MSGGMGPLGREVERFPFSGQDFGQGFSSFYAAWYLRERNAVSISSGWVLIVYWIVMKNKSSELTRLD